MAGGPRAPLRSGGFYGTYNRRGRNELKFTDTGDGGGSAPAAGILVLLNGVAAGTDYNQRIGRKIILKSLLHRFSLIPQVATANSSAGDIVWVMLIYDCQTNAATPAVADVLQAVTYDSPMNLNNRDRFKVLTDKFITMGAYTMTASALVTGSPTPKIIKMYKRLNHEVIFGGTGSTVGSIQTGAIFLLIISLNNNITTYVYNNRTRFIDS